MALPTQPFARKQFALPDFELLPLEFEPGQAEEADELLLDRAVSRPGPANVVALVQPLPTAGELRASIERHLSERGGESAADRPADAAEELRSALAELRRSLG